MNMLDYEIDGDLIVASARNYDVSVRHGGRYVVFKRRLNIFIILG
jgi:hypothetical protein